MFYIYQCPVCKSSICSQHYATHNNHIVQSVTMACAACKQTKNYNFFLQQMATTPRQIKSFKESNVYKNCVAVDVDVINHKNPK